MQDLIDERSMFLREQEAFRLMFEQAGFGVAQVSLSGQWLAVNQALCAILGYSREELLRKTLLEITRFDELAAERNDCHRLLDGEIPSFSSQKRHLRADGRVVWLRATITLLRDAATGTPEGFLGVVEDLTLQRKASQQRQAGFDNLMTRILSRFTACLPSQVDDSVVLALQETAEFIGVDHAHVLLFSPDRTSWSATHEWCGSNVSAQRHFYQDVRSGAAPWSESAILSGDVIRINTLADYPAEAVKERATADALAGMKSILLVPIRGAAGEIAGAVGFDSHMQEVIWSDADVAHCRIVGDAIATVLERKRADEAMRESEERFRVMADSAPIMMWMAGLDKGCTAFNRGWLEFTGRSAEQEQGDGWAQGVHAADLERCVSIYHAAFDKRRRFNMEYRLRRRDGNYRWIRDTGVPRFLPDGSFVGYIGCCIDIDDQKQAELARTDLSRRLMTAQEAERTRIARELHDGIGQALALLSVQLQKAGQPATGERRTPGVSELCNKVKEIGTQVSRLSHQLHSSELEFLGLAVAVKSLCREYSEQYHIVIDCSCTDIPAELENDFALCFLRVVQEALHNVAKHSRATAVCVELTADGNDLALTIQDNGIGFEMSKVGSTAGLGMISMRERMHLIGGEFHITSKPGTGTRLQARAPLARAEHRSRADE